MIPRSAITDALREKLLAGIKRYSNGRSGRTNQEDLQEAIDDGRDDIDVYTGDLANVKYRGNPRQYVQRPDLAEDRRFTQAVDEVFEAYDGNDQVSLNLFLDRLDEIVVSESMQKQTFAKKLRSFAPLIRQLRQSEAWQKVLLFQKEEKKRREQARLSDALAQETSAGDEYRGILRALVTEQSTRDQLEMVLDDESQKISERVRKERLRNGAYVPLLVIGAGVHSSIFTSELMRSNPKLAQNAVVIESRKRLGGQFRAVGGAGYFMNSRANRAHNYMNPDKNMPGETGNINSMGDNAILQLSDVEARVYSDNETFGLVAALNSFLSADTALGLEIVEVRRQKSNRVNGGQYEVELRDVETGERIRITTDCVVGSTGLGEPLLPFDATDSDTKGILGRRLDDDQLLVPPKGDVPGLPRLATSAEFWEFAGNNRNWQPLVDLAGKNIVVVGDADSAQTILEKLNGILAAPTLDTATSLRIAADGAEKPITITVVGAKQKDYETYIKGRRVRYHFVSLFYPRQDGSRNNDTITPLEGRATTLSQGGDGRLRVNYFEESNESDLGIEVLKQTDAADLVITSTGFKDKSKEIFKEFQDPFAGKEIDSPDTTEVQLGLSRVGTEFRLPGSNPSGVAITIEKTSVQQDVFNAITTPLSIRVRSGAISFKRDITLNDFLSEYAPRVQSMRFPDKAEDTSRVLRQNDRPIGRQIGNEQIFVIGVAGKDYEFSDEEKATYPEATQSAVKILVNTDAVWRLAGGSEAFARTIVPDVMQGINWEEKVERDKQFRQESAEKLGMPSGERPRFFVFDLGEESDDGQLPLNANALNLLREALSRRLAKWRLDSKDAQNLNDKFNGEMKLRFIRTFRDTYAITITPPVLPISVIKEVLTDLGSEQVRDIRRAVKALLANRGSRDAIRNNRFISGERLSQPIIQYRPSLSLGFSYDGGRFQPVSQSTENFDLLPKGSDVKLESVTQLASSDNPQDFVQSELFDGDRVSKKTLNIVRQVLAGETLGAKEEAAPAVQAESPSRSEFGGIGPEDAVTGTQARALFEAGLLTFENFFKLLETRDRDYEPTKALQDVQDLLKKPLTLRINPEQKARLLALAINARNKFKSASAASENWNQIIDVITEI